MRTKRSLPESFQALARDLGSERVRFGEPLAPYTTFQIGGPADLFYEPRTPDELARALLAARARGVPSFLLGLGANILVGDRGFRGLVVRNAARAVEVLEEERRVVAASGAVVWPDLIETAIAHALSGLEHYVGIPSTVGGALWQNLHFLSPAPARERTMFIAEVTLGAEILTGEGERRWVDAAWFEFGYDTSILHHRPDVVLSATFQLAPGDPETMRRIVRENLEWRAHRHPPLDREPSVGSIFKKIAGIGAGRLIDQCGLKGARVGAAVVTDRHANIIVNEGGATASDVRALIALVQEKVERETGHRLEPEISFVGEF
ncbi:MAG TPA: UDP-N-acetylmuramate dehydrogenase [Thermoanaerobaculia bacterium]|nr:UDP-N-acetylmuramate dehydrogenase [Thermoanaerobaculia bacterium]